MKLIEEGPIPLAALPMDAFKAHLRLGSGFAEDDVQDDVLEAFLRAAIAAVEARVEKAVITRAFTATLFDWRDETGQTLPLAPVSEVSEVRVVDASGGSDVVDPAQYWLKDDGMRAWLMPAATCLPSIPDKGRVEIAFNAGFASDWSGIPADLGQAVLLLAAHYYEFRNDTALKDGCMPFGVTSLIARYRSMRLGATT